MNEQKKKAVKIKNVVNFHLDDVGKMVYPIKYKGKLYTVKILSFHDMVRIKIYEYDGFLPFMNFGNLVWSYDSEFIITANGQSVNISPTYKNIKLNTEKIMKAIFCLYEEVKALDEEEKKKLEQSSSWDGTIN